MRPFSPCALALASLLMLLPGQALAQAISLDDFPKADLDEVPEKYRLWVTEQVGHIITPAEYEVFLRLGSDASYELFMEEFWTNRDPTPGTPRNEYQELHYERLEYANEFYGRGTHREGWQTDRGKMHILFGPPQGVTRTPSEMLTYPTEVWFYAVDPETGLPPFFYLLFYQRYGNGEFRLYSPLSDGPDKLLNGAGIREMEQRIERFASGRSRGFAPTGYGRDAEAIHSILIEINHDLASAAFSYYPSEAGMEFGITPLATEMLIASIDEVPAKMMPDATWAYNVLTGVTESDVRFETLDLAATAVPLIDIDGEPFIHFATKAPGEQLNVGEYDGSYYFSFQSNGSVVDDQTRVLQNFEARMSGDLEEEQARRFTSNPFVYMDMIPTLPGSQQFSLMLENTVAHSFGRAELELTVPRARPARPEIAGPVLALDLQQREFDPYAERYPFQYRELAMVPSVDHLFDAGSPIHVFAQALLPAGGTSAVTARYSLLEPSGSAVREDSTPLGPDNADDHGVAPLLWTIDTAGLGAGEYRLRLSVDENTSATRSVTLRIRERPATPDRPFINAQPAPPPSDVEIALERAAQHRIVGQPEEAIAWLEFAAGREPEDEEVQARYVELLEDTGQHQALIEVLTPLSARNPRDLETLRRLARAHALLGQHYDAIRYYERIRLASETEEVAILNALAAEYDAEGNPDKVREILTLSLELNPEQPEIQRMLERVSAQATGSRD